MRVAVLGSGSGGNSVVVESQGRRILIDIGFSCRQIETRLETLDVEADSIEAMLLTHEHQDHCRGAAVFVKRYGVPIYATDGTFAALSSSKSFKKAEPVTRTVRSGEPFDIHGADPMFHVEAFGVPHDAREPVGFVIEDAAGCRLGLAADLGARTQLAWGRLRDIDCLILETNHDLSLLRNGPYPWHLKQRIASRHGHLSNDEAASGLPELVSDRLRSVVLYHLSETNNRPELAADAIGDRLAILDCAAEVFMTHQNSVSPWIEIPEGDFARQRPEPDPSQLRLW